MAAEEEILPNDNEYGDMLVQKLQQTHMNEREVLLILVGKYNNFKEQFYKELSEIKQLYRDNNIDKNRILELMDNRIKKLEDEDLAINPQKMLETMAKSQKDIEDEKKELYRIEITWRLTIAFCALLGGLIGFLLKALLDAKLVFGF